MSDWVWVKSCDSDAAFVGIDAEFGNDRHGACDKKDVVEVLVDVVDTCNNVFGCVVTECLLVMS